jgi:arylsulfatase A-like enzyme
MSGRTDRSQSPVPCVPDARAFEGHESGKAEPAQAFATLIEGMDKSLGDALDHLDTLGVAENTLPIVLGDNGSDAPLAISTTWRPPRRCAAGGRALRGGTRLFNLKRDPFEQKDLAATEPVELRRLMQGMIAALARQQAVYPVEKDGRTRVKPKVPSPS